MGLLGLAAVVVLSISFIIADEFSVIASNKGYPDRKYFWYCFLFGIAGYLMVAALPPKLAENKENDSENSFDKGALEEGGIIQCPVCGAYHDSELSVCPSCKYEYVSENRTDEK